MKYDEEPIDCGNPEHGDAYQGEHARLTITLVNGSRLNFKLNPAEAGCYQLLPFVDVTGKAAFGLERLPEKPGNFSWVIVADGERGAFTQIDSW